MNPGQEALKWTQLIWDAINRAVHDECARTKIAAKFLPMYGPVSMDETNIHSDEVAAAKTTLSVIETEMTDILEIAVDFLLTKSQVEREESRRTAMTLATRAANLLSQAEDVIIFQGQAAIVKGNAQHPLFKDQKVNHLSGAAGTGLLNAPKAPIQIVDVSPLPPPPAPAPPPPPPPRYGENTFGGVSTGYSRLQSGTGLNQAHYGPYALVLHHEPYADTHAPLEKTLIMPRDRIMALVEKGFYGTGTLPPSTGLLVSLGGNTMDLVVAQDAITAFLQIDTDQRFRFRVYERFALRLKDESAVIRLDFK